MTMDFEEEQRKMADCSREALYAGVVSGAKTLAGTGVAVGAAVRFWPAFQRATRVSSRTALVISLPIFAFFLRTEHTMTSCARRNHALDAALRRAPHLVAVSASIVFAQKTPLRALA